MRSLTLALTLLASSAFAGEHRDAVLTLLGGIEDPPSADALEAIGPGVEAELMELAQDSSIPRSKRARAVHALGWFPSDETLAFLRTALAGQEAILRRKAAYALGNGWGDDALPDLEQALADDDVQLRMAAARSLGRIDTEGAREALDRRLVVEQTPAVRTTIEQQLGR